MKGDLEGRRQKVEGRSKKAEGRSKKVEGTKAYISSFVEIYNGWFISPKLY
ncbi:MAG: hypothetical protein HC785_02100 [Calothrix sp. CSU_2_0]|nr:hypothetical protein [Calothrix sp. CSU_2_0]